MARKKSNKGKGSKLAQAAATTSKEEAVKGITGLPPAKRQLGLLITGELDQALADCKSKVKRIARTCRANNRKFRDLEFDIDNDQIRCLYGLSPEATTHPRDVRRVTEIYDKPSFFVDGVTAADIVQGNLNNSWFLSALATLASAKGLIENCCVARDEEVGVYGFIFFRHNAWESVIIDDQLFWSLPKYEELRVEEQKLWHNDKELYNEVARKRGQGLYFAKSREPGETWVPLIEKAYAKLHGDYSALESGRHHEALEDLTGGVSLFIKAGDILNREKFWREELSHAGNHHLFGVTLPKINTSNNPYVKVKGLIPNRAYSVIRTQECRGKKFVIIRNPWGSSEWTGPWSDGSKEWNGESLSMLSELGHTLGDDGEFVMEYSDFLSTWDLIERTTIFDSSWTMSSHWIGVPAPPELHPWSFGHIIFNFTLPERSEAMIVLSQMGHRYFKAISGYSTWQLDFVLHKSGEADYLATSSYGIPNGRSVMCELTLDPGDYVVLVRADRFIDRDQCYFTPDNCSRVYNERKLSRVLSQRAKSRCITSNLTPEYRYLPLPLDFVIAEAPGLLRIDELPIVGEGESEAAEATGEGAGGKSESEGEDNKEGEENKEGEDNKEGGDDRKSEDDEESEGEDSYSEEGPVGTAPVRPDDPLFLGLRVYTKQNAPVKSISGHVFPR